MRCSECDGSGQVQRVRQSLLGQMVTASPCPRCGGLGEVITTPCSSCRGEGRVTEDVSYKVDIPAGVDTGSTLRLTQRGAAGPRGGARGDLYVHLRVRPDEAYTRDGNDLVTEVPISIAQAALGTSMELETLDGTEDLVIPPGTQPGREFVLRQRGVPHLQGRGRGDLIARVRVDIPTKLTDDEIDLLRDLRRGTWRVGRERQGRPVLEDQVGLLLTWPNTIADGPPPRCCSTRSMPVCSTTGLIVPPDDVEHHLRRVLRVRDGDSIAVTDGAGRWRMAVVRLSGSSLTLEAVGAVTVDDRPEPFTLATAMPKGDRLDWLVQKTVELGVDRIVLLHAERSTVRWKADRAEKQLVRLRRIADESTRQSRRVWRTEIDGPVDADEVLPLAAVAEPGAAGAVGRRVDDRDRARRRLDR